MHINTSRAAGECRRQVKNVTNLVKIVSIVEFHDRVWNQYEKYIQISTNMTGIGSLICEIDIKISQISESNKFCCSVGPMPTV